jgi:DNA-binding MltR family transcriptional regulator
VANREALRKLSRRFPAPLETRNILDALDKEPDRSVAIVSASLLEAALERLLIRKFTCFDNDLLGRLFQNRGPLSDFHCKILIATAFGAISTGTAEELHAIKAIRNAFAHASANITFDTQEVAKEVDNLGILKVFAEQGKKYGFIPAPDKDGFILVVRVLFAIVELSLREPGDRPLSLRESVEKVEETPPTSA